MYKRQAYVSLVKLGVPSASASALAGRLLGGIIEDNAVQPWAELLRGDEGPKLVSLLTSKEKGDVRGDLETVQKLVAAATDDARKSALLS